MGQFGKVLFDIDNSHTVPDRALDWELSLVSLNQAYGPKHLTPSI